MQTLEELNAHYKAVRARLNGNPQPKPVFIAPPEPEPEPEPEPVVQVILLEPMPLTSTQQILKEVAEKYEITVQDLKGPCRKLKYALPRHEAADRIEKLEAALREIASIDSYYVSDIVDFARKALEGKDD